ncbi:MAG TPA: alpha/beta hydrolase, partial [Acetobacteraceae bacterium]|nr:alpha/beta hydrolase [Acetobacteraceae bacterium]
MDTHRIITPDGVGIAVRESGPPDAPPVVLIHGFSQCSLSWSRQMVGPLARTHRLVAYDIRGHGASDKPLDPAAYRNPAAWAGEAQAVIGQLGLVRPVLVGWSYGGRIVADYLAAHGDGALGGIVFVAAAVASVPSLFGPKRGLLAETGSADLETSIAGTRAFLRACFAVPPEGEDFETMLAFNAMVPPAVRAAMGGRMADYDPVLRALRVPVLAIHGADDAIILPAMSHHIAAIAPGARAVIYERVGHAPFWEAATQFDADVAA